jgi:hypothetical protein
MATFELINDLAYYKMNDMYLDIQAGRTKMSTRIRLQLEHLLNYAYPASEQSMRVYWFSEFQKLPGWFDF